MDRREPRQFQNILTRLFFASLKYELAKLFKRQIDEGPPALSYAEGHMDNGANFMV
jgi:hypothetical protein